MSWVFSRRWVQRCANNCITSVTEDASSTTLGHGGMEVPVNVSQGVWEFHNLPVPNTALSPSGLLPHEVGNRGSLLPNTIVTTMTDIPGGRGEREPVSNTALSPSLIRQTWLAPSYLRRGTTGNRNPRTGLRDNVPDRPSTKVAPVPPLSSILVHVAVVAFNHTFPTPTENSENAEDIIHRSATIAAYCAYISRHV